MARHKPPVLQSLSDTVLLVAYHRALETRRPDALFKDGLAERLSAGRGELIARKLITYARALAWSTIVRTVVIDEILLRLVPAVDTVLNLAAGLDMRPYRLSLPGSLRWIEVDLPEILPDKAQALVEERSICKLERLALELSNPSARRQVLADVAGQAERQWCSL